MWKWKQSTRLVNVLGEDHKPVKQRSRLHSLKNLKQERPEVLFYSFIKLPEGKMSTKTAMLAWRRP